MQDAIGHDIQIGDYVTAVWANGDLALFKVLGEKARQRKWSNVEPELKLERLFSEPWNKSNNKPTYKKYSQVTWVDPNYVVMHLMAK